MKLASLGFPSLVGVLTLQVTTVARPTEAQGMCSGFRSCFNVTKHGQVLTVTITTDLTPTAGSDALT
jgi:hypothetical protein